MRSLYTGGLFAATVLGLTACGGSPPPTQVTVATPAPSAPLTVIGAPPPPQVEVIPPSPGGAVWQAGHWRWTGVAGSEWQWVPGQYVVPPVTASRWIPGQWVQQPGGGWSWIDGHWG